MQLIFDQKIDGMKRFVIIWFGQFVSLMGTSMTKFALGIWAYQQVGKASTMALLMFFSYLPYVVFSPFAGSVVDRYSRKTIMVLSDLGAGLVTVFILFLHLRGDLSIWHLYLAETLMGALEAFQIPAYSASITLLIPKAKYSKASGLRSFAASSSRVFAPVLAGFFLIQTGLRGVLVMDLLTFFMAMGTLLIVKIPNPVRRAEDEQEMGTWKNLKFSMNYLLEKRGLLMLLVVFVFVNLFAAMTYFGILPAMILARSGNNELVWATVQSVLGVGGVVGGLLVSIFGVPKNKTLTIVATGGTSFLLGDILFATGTTVYVWAVAAFLSAVFVPYMLGASESIWQSKVEPEIQGRIFSIKVMIQTCAMPLGFLLGGFLADYVFEPAMISPTLLNRIFGRVVGSRAGSGMALMFLMTGILGGLTCLVAYQNKEFRYLEKNIADYDLEVEQLDLS